MKQKTQKYGNDELQDNFDFDSEKEQVMEENNNGQPEETDK